MDRTTMIARIDASVDRLPRALERTCAWAWIAHVIAQADLLGDSAIPPSASCWVEPRMAWILEDLAGVGVRTDPIPVPTISPGHVATVLATVLDRLVASAGAPPLRATPAQVDATVRTLARALAARADLLATSS